ncbi:MAG: hypothetical protein D6820_01230 [Lentisphaerae bacterium]|nr:MAG: hypothetical protein D6820_01230 [Lentisphaerota bacterium]
MNKLKVIACGMVVAAAAFHSGCTTMYATPQPVAILIEDQYDPVTSVKNRQDPVEIIYFARTLAAEGRNLDAARIYLDAANRFRSVDGKFENDCRKEAVRQYWLAGQKQKAWDLFNQLNNEQDIYRRAEEEKNLRMLRELLTSDNSNQIQ